LQLPRLERLAHFQPAVGQTQMQQARAALGVADFHRMLKNQDFHLISSAVTQRQMQVCCGRRHAAHMARRVGLRDWRYS
jgi:hypothetical protein